MMALYSEIMDLKSPKLVSMSDFVLMQRDIIANFDTKNVRTQLPFEIIVRYAEFLKTPIDLKLFYPIENSIFVGAKEKEYGRIVIYSDIGLEKEITVANSKIKKALPNWTIEDLVKNNVRIKSDWFTQNIL
jgi:hypothetical protein